jgi:hypothetical protein
MEDYIEECSLTGEPITQGILTKYYNEEYQGKTYLVIEQEGNKVKLDLNQCAGVPRMAVRFLWSV